jgi:CubicO group peptidase (beta-lactamase class C family)
LNLYHSLRKVTPRSQCSCSERNLLPYLSEARSNYCSKLPRAAKDNEVSDVLTQRLQELVNGLVSRKGIQHAITAVARCDGSLRWVGAVGDANPDGTPMRPDTPFFIASVDKLFTATVILKLRERRQVDLDDSISTYLPQTLIGGLHRLSGVDYTNTITVRHLLSHTSGLADWLEDRPKGGRSLVERLIQEGDLALSIDDLFHIVRDQLSPHFPPQPVEARRQKVRYCDTNYILLIAIIEAVTGQRLHQVHEELLFRPLALRHTWLAGHSRPLEPTPEPATLWVDDRPMDIPLFFQSSWAVYSTAEDTLSFLRALIRSEVFDDPATLPLMQRRWNRFGVPLDRAALRLPSWPIEYGLGFMRFHDPLLKLLARLPRVVVPIYPAPAVIGHTGSTGSWLFHCPQLNVLLAGTVDQARAGAVPYRLVPKILEVVDDYGWQTRSSGYSFSRRDD